MCPVSSDTNSWKAACASKGTTSDGSAALISLFRSQCSSAFYELEADEAGHERTRQETARLWENNKQTYLAFYPLFSIVSALILSP